MMGRSRNRDDEGGPPTLSIVGPGMQVLGDCVTDGTLRIEGHVKGSVYAAKAVVVGRGGTVEGDIRTQDAVIAGTIVGTLVAASRLEVKDAARIEGRVHARRLQLAEGAVLNGEVRMGEIDQGPPPDGAEPGSAESSSDPETLELREPEAVGTR